MHPAGDAQDGAMLRALEAGLPAEHVAVLMAARRDWWARNTRKAAAVSATVTAEEVLWAASLRAALEHPAADAFDEVFVAAMRREQTVW